ncbi:MAG: OmpA family protein [Paludibacteraceae bacterium]|nr:OmpA family protein [Paludibacteraceae bacterium]
MKRIIYILLMALGMTVVVPAVSVLDSSVATAYAVDAKAKAKAQKEKEKAEKAKEREKAKAKAAKEREKAAAQRKKEQAKAAAQKQKDQQKKQQAKAKQQSKQQQAKAKSSQTASNKAKQTKPAQPALTAAEEKAQYMAAVAAIDKTNAKANAYNNRDIAHRLGFWGHVGYSDLMTSGIQYEPASATRPNAFGFETKDKGFVGGGAGVGYQLRYKQFLFTTGVEFTFYNAVKDLSSSENGDIRRVYGMEPYSNTMIYTYNFSNVSEKIIGGFAQVPILFGMEFKRIPLFWQVGAKVGYGVYSKATLSGKLTTSIVDKELIEGMSNMYKHTLVNDQKIDRPANSVNFGLNLAATAEVGINFDRWMKSAARVRLSLFADYGVINALSYKAAEGAQDLPMQLAKKGVSPLDYTVNASFATTAAEKAEVNPFLVGAKIAVWFDLPRKQKATQEYPKAPTPRMGVYMYDDSSDKALGGVAVEITNVETGKKLQKNTNRQGLLQGRFAPGQYSISATKNGYYPSDTILKTVEVFDFDTLRLPLQRIPAPIIPMLCMNIYDDETKEPIEATARITALNDTAVLYAAQSADDGFIETPLTEGTYVAHMNAVGYMPKDDTLRFVQDTFDIYMQPIKEGIKVKIENLFFATNKTYILPQSEQAMSDLANFLLENASVKIHVVGHTDAVGTDEANQILSEGRANSVRNDLIKRGVAAERITAEGKGEKEPVADNDTEEGRQLNRRVEFTITDVGDEDIQQIY